MTKIVQSECFIVWTVHVLPSIHTYTVKTYAVARTDILVMMMRIAGGLL